MVRLLAAAGIVLASAAGTMQIRSSDFSDGGVIPKRAMAADCGGNNASPALAWTGAPRATKSFALILHDGDAPIPGGFYHWVVYNLPASTQALAAGARLAADQLGETSAGGAGYYGPCPPPGRVHHYVLTVFALDVTKVGADAPLTGAQLQARIGGHVLARGVLRGTEARR